MDKVCVIGGSGFLGSHVCDVLSENGYEVIVFDKSPSRWIKEHQHMCIGDLSDIEALTNATSDCRAVFNFAAIADLDIALNQPLETAAINIIGNINVLEACRLNKIPRYIYASTVYVNSREGGFYRCSKYAAELYVEEYQKRYGQDYTILRYGSLYGPRSDLNNGLRKIISKALANGYVEYEGSPEAMREYIHVRDAAEASVAALNSNFLNQRVVLTGQESMKVIDLLKMVAEILNFKQDVLFKPSEHAGHYIRTPYAYDPKIGKKYVLPIHIDLGQGILELVEHIQLDSKK
jgi:UDP-glucose 4-epimerase